MRWVLMLGKGSNSLKLAVLAAIPLLLIGGVTLAWVFPTASNQGYAPDQPIPFSHKLHAGDNKIACLYCHSSAEKSQHASIPPVGLCMNCHKQVKTDSPWIQKLTQAYNNGEPIEWVRIHELPDHAHFPHLRHVNAGVSCQTCHGPIETMEKVYQAAPLTMGWCIDCHRGETTPKAVLKKKFPDEANPHGKQVASQNCSACHY
jgi:hypothetical protein